MAEIKKPAVELLTQLEPELFWQLHGRNIVWGFVAVLAAIVVVVQVQRQAAERETESADRIAQAVEPGLLLQLAHEYKGKNLGAQALLRLADVQTQAGHLTEALGAYQEFLTAYPQHPLVDSAQLGQAASLESAGKLEDAKARYLQLSARPGSYTSIAAKLGAARCAETLGQTKEARQLYEELAPVVAGTQWALPVALRLDVLARSKETAIASVSPVTTIAPGGLK